MSATKEPKPVVSVGYGVLIAAALAADVLLLMMANGDQEAARWSMLALPLVPLCACVVAAMREIRKARHVRNSGCRYPYWLPWGHY